MQAIVDLAGIPVIERALPDGTRATIGDVAGRRRSVIEPEVEVLLGERAAVFYEREARAFAAELLMPFAEVRRRWFGLSAQGTTVEEMVRRLAGEFGVTPAAIRVRLQQMKLVPRSTP